MRHPSSHRNRSGLELKMTPMIDVVFLLLIYFVCTASFAQIENVLPSDVAPLAGNTQQPIDQPPEIEDLERIVVRILAQAPGQRPTWQVNDEPRQDLSAVRTRLAAIRKAMLASGADLAELPLVVDADDDVSLGDVIDTYDVARGLGYRKIQMAAGE